ncbi:cell division FtsK/SpoIIIE [Kyrpidia tusciae DSM 2912]|uniref:Cell division FtsK/SpoIIIE n=2 Tax=Kyrpidia TaxID=1129704 RepID=D5WPP5_KYRT2|nr:cell division FtsK/SpoIIIE [Kyrpidia tusciae DSM 2912]
MSKVEQAKEWMKTEITGLAIVAASLICLAQLGWIGRSLAHLAMWVAGGWYVLVPLAMLWVGGYVIVKGRAPSWNLRVTGVFLFIAVLLTWEQLNLYTSLIRSHPLTPPDLWTITTHRIDQLYLASTGATEGGHPVAPPERVGGGAVGYALFSATHFLFDTLGTEIVLLISAMAAIILATGQSALSVWETLKRWGVQLAQGISTRIKALADAWRATSDADAQAAGRRRTPKGGRKASEEAFPIRDFSEAGAWVEEEAQPDTIVAPPAVDAGTEADEDDPVAVVDEAKSRIQVRLSKDRPSGVGPTPEEGTVVSASPLGRTYHLPSIGLLNPAPPGRNSSDLKDVAANAHKLEQTLESFGVKAKVLQAYRGPAVTRYEIQPAVGVKVSRIVALTDDLALALAAPDIRMEAPIPGKSAIGIEVPNREIAIIPLREVLETPEFTQAKSLLTLALGRDISGTPVMADLAKMPHLLIAGATGSGKSVCINSLIISLLFRADPDQVKLVMIDPKMVELGVYGGIPHLMAPVVTDMRKAAATLKKVVEEMEGRYALFAREGVRDMERYNELARRFGRPLLPYIVVVVDELSDLMMVAPGEVEDAICRLAQMARAAGIHLIVATQRPSVDVITGLIKANIPSRIAFAVSSQADSRTILDMGGAEKLLGRGDMLFLPVGAPKPIRVQGAFVSEAEVERVVEAVKTQMPAQYREDWDVSGGEESPQEDLDPLFDEAVALVVGSGQASVSLLQRRLRIGYTRAARLIDQMEGRGVVGPFEGSKPREVLWTPAQLERRRGSQHP